jgi:hypothetical protein
VALLLSTINLANAALVKTTADFTITNISGSFAAVSVGEAFKFTAIYDDEGTSMTQNSDYILCLDTDPNATTNCNDVYRSVDYGFFSNAMLNFDGMFDLDLVSASTSDLLNNNGTSTVQWAYEDTGNITLDIQEGPFNAFFMISEMYGAASMHTSSFNGGIVENKVDFTATNLTTSAVEVSAPATFSLFALGLFGMAARRFKKQY